MMSLVRLRIALADQPGALARVAAIIAEHGGNITAVDVHHQAGGNAVDDVVVEWPDEGSDLDHLRNALAGSGAGALVSHQAGRQLDPVVAALRRAVDMVAGGGDSDDDLVAAVAEICASPAVWVSGAGEDNDIEAGRMAREGGGAVSVHTSALPPEVAERLPGDAWLLAVPDPEVVDGRVVFVARGPQSEFTTTEIARIEALMALHARIARLRPAR